MNERAHSVVTNIAAIADGCARHRAGLCQEEVAARMFTTKSVVSRLERERARPTLRTIEHYTWAVGARVQLRVLR